MAGANERAGLHSPLVQARIATHTTVLDPASASGLLLVLVLLWWAIWFLWSISS